MKNPEAFTRHKQRIEKTACNPASYHRYDQISRERWLQRIRENTERRKRLNPRLLVLEESFFDDLLLEQQEQGG